jgi:PAS domain S-box-containing protein
MANPGMPIAHAGKRAPRDQQPGIDMSSESNPVKPSEKRRRSGPRGSTQATHGSAAFADEGEYFQRFAESSEDVFWFADLPAQTLLYVSPRFEQWWGVRADQLLADPAHWNRAVLADDAKRLPKPFFADDPTQGETLREYRITSRTGEIRWIRDRRFHLRDESGCTVRIGGIAEDVTERKQQELATADLLSRERQARAEAEAAAQAKDEFLAVVTHELRSPLNAIRGWAHVLRHAAALQGVQARALDAIDRNTQAQTQLVDDLLDSQRILCGKLQLELQHIPLARVIDEAVEAVLPMAEHKRIRVEVRHDRRVGFMRADFDRLRQSVLKLLSNAVKFTPEDGIVNVTSERRDECLAIEVRDTGVGLEPAQLPLVFERFQQGDSSSTRHSGGLGLGLSLAQQLVELHGGSITVSSAGPGQGTTFTIQLPQQLLLDEPFLPDAAADTRSPLAGKRIVIVEDDADGREALSLILRSAQAELYSFDSAAAAYHYLSETAPQEQPDALISDIAMPGEDGYAFIRRVRTLEGGERRPHIVALALTAFSRVEDRMRALKAGFDAHVSKPIDPDRVVQTLADALAHPPGPAAEAGPN